MFFQNMLFIFLFATATADFNIDQSVYNFSVTAFQDCYNINNNFVMSPLSAQVVLALAYAGASGQTAQAMNTGLDLIGQTQPQVVNDFNALMSSFTQLNGDTTLNIANKIYINDSFQLSSSYQSVTTQFYSAVETINFVDNTNAANEINAWASKETAGNIQNVVDSSEFSDKTSMVLLNAIYFKGIWKIQFATAATHPGTFHYSKTATQQIPFMHVTESFNFGSSRTLKANILQMYYTDHTLSMLFIVPNAIDGLADMISKLQNVNIANILGDIYSRKVIVAIPKFTIKSDFSLNAALAKMGMGIIFGSEADFSGMVTQVPPNDYLSISSVSQNALIEVNEHGAKAAAVTVVSMSLMSRPAPPPPRPPKFIADHPFLYMILKNNDPLFIGTFVKGDTTPPPISIPSSIENNGNIVSTPPTHNNGNSFSPPPTNQNQNSFSPPPTNQNSFSPPPTNNNEKSSSPPPTIVNENSSSPPPTIGNDNSSPSLMDTYSYLYE